MRSVLAGGGWFRDRAVITERAVQRGHSRRVSAGLSCHTPRGDKVRGAAAVCSTGLDQFSEEHLLVGESEGGEPGQRVAGCVVGAPGHGSSARPSAR